MDGLVDGWMDGWMNESTVEWMGECLMDGWMEGGRGGMDGTSKHISCTLTYIQTNTHTYKLNNHR